MIQKIKLFFIRVYNYFFRKTLLVRYVGVILLGIGLYIAFNYYDYPADGDLVKVVQDFYANASAELISIAITILIVDFLYDVRNGEYERQNLIRDFASGVDSLTKRAYRELREKKLLTNRKLRGANLSHADLSGYDLKGSYLVGVDFSNATLNLTDFTGSKLSNCNFAGATGTKTKFERCELYNCTFSDTEFKDSNFKGAFLDGSKGEVILFNDSDFTGATFGAVEFADANFKLAHLVDATFVGGVLNHPDFDNTDFTGCTFTRTNFEHVMNFQSIIGAKQSSFVGIKHNVPEFGAWKQALPN